MSTKHQRDIELAERKQQLLIRSAELRVSMAHHARALRGPLSVVDQAMAGAQWLRTHPAWPLGTMLMLAVLRPRRILRWGFRLWGGWRLFGKARDWLDNVAPK